MIGSGSLVGSSLDQANVIEGNQTGVSIAGNIQFQKIYRNSVGVVAASHQLIANNVLTGNALGIQVSGKSVTRIVANTMYTRLGDNVRIINASSETELRNNILWTADGYDIYVSDNSTKGFFSDFNALFTTGAGKIGYWTKDFTDILDWQQDIYRFDLNSIGTTSVNPTDAQPQFFNAARDNFRVFTTTAGQRLTSPTIDRADVLNDLALASGYSNLLTNPSFENGLNGWQVTPGGSSPSDFIKSSTPAAFAGSSYFFSGPNQTTLLSQSVDLTSGYSTAQLDSRTLLAAFGGRVRAANETVSDRGTLTVSFLDGAGNVIGQPFISQAKNDSERWELIGDHAVLPVGVRSIRYQFDAVRQSGSTNDVYLDRAFVSILPGSFAPDQGASSHTSEDRDNGARLRLISPDLYQDWELNKPIDIRWDSLGNTTNSPVVIELLRDTATGPVLDRVISSGTADDGAFSWIAGNSGLTSGTHGWRIQVSLASNRTVLDRSSEAFSVPENTSTFFVNDNSNLGNEFTTAVGSNRNTGKLASAPKPYPNNVLRVYSVGANQFLSVDAGSYPLLYPLVVSNIPGGQDDEGFTFRGSVNQTTDFHHANPLTVAPVLELNDADGMTLRNLTISGGNIGLWVRNDSIELAASYVSALNNNGRGFQIDTASVATNLDHLIADGNSGAGFYANASIGSLIDSRFSNNRSYGIHLLDTGATKLEGNTIYNNTGISVHGVLITNTVGGTLVFGNADLTLGRGNIVHDNSAAGIVASGQVSVAGNTVYGQLALTLTGISAFNGATVSRNVVHDSYIGIFSSAGEISENRVYNNLEAGISLAGASRAARNVVYSNAMGVRGQAGWQGTLINNLVYDNTSYGVLITNASTGLISSPLVVNNTIYQTSGDALRVQNSSSNLRVRNNILAVASGVALSVATDSQTGFQSDYNAFYLTGTGKTASWENIDRPTLAGWQTTAFQDNNSISADPSFVNMLGPDGQLGYVSPASDGRDDDFHLKSAYGSYHGASFAPVATANGLGVPVALTTSTTPALDALTSPLLDRGDAVDSVALEPTPNGSYINIGGYGGTSQASLSPAEYVTVIKPVGGEVWPQQQTFPIRWRSQKFIPVVSNYALSFDGVDDYVDLGNLGATPTQGTLEFLVNPTVVNSYRNVMTTSWGGGNAGFRFEENGNQFAVAVGNDGGGFGGYLLTSTAPLVAGQLTHFAITWDIATNNVKGYQNGVLQFDATNTTWPTQLNNVRLGMGYSDDRAYAGTLDDVRFWNTQRTQAEIDTSRNQKLTGTEAGLLALYQFDEGSGTTAHNLVNNGHDGVLGGGVTASRPTWVANGNNDALTFKIELLHLGSSTPVYTIAAAAPDTGAFNWTIPASIPPADDYIIRVTRNDAAAAANVSDGAISIRTPVSVYYVNDGAFEPGDLTTAMGNDVTGNGTSPTSPRASISSILNDYPLKAGDTIFVDAGTYNLNTSLVLTAAASGIRIEGYHNAAYPNRSTIIDRGNISSSVIELQNVDNLTLDHLTIQGGISGIHASTSSDSDGLTISNSLIQFNDQIGIRLEESNDQAFIINSTFDGGTGTAKQSIHLYTDGVGFTVSNNLFTRARSQAIGNINGNHLLLADNQFMDNANGISIANSSIAPADAGEIRNNLIVGRALSGVGIFVLHNMLVTGNDVSGTQVGIQGSGEFRDNVVHDNVWGIFSEGTALIVGNRVYHNRDYGIVADSASRPIENRVYNNAIGLVTGLRFGGSVANNLIYENTSVGILISGSNGASYVNNTVYQLTGDAIKLQDSRTQNINIRNNILSAATGYLLSVDPVSTRGFKSDYNVLSTSGTGQIAFWENRSFTNKANWFYEVGQDGHSLLSAPQFVDIDGADNVLGFSHGTGLTANYYATNDLNGTPYATRVDSTIGFNVGGGTPLSGLPVDNFSIRWDGYLYIPQAGSYTFYETSDDGMRLYLNAVTTPNIDQWNYVSLAQRSYTTTFAAAGWIPIRIEHRELTGAASLDVSWSGPGFNQQAINSDNLSPTLIVANGDYGADDNFTLPVGSPTIDAGDPNSLFFREVQPNGGRVDIGAYGNTPLANLSAVQSIQVLSPNGLEKLEQGQVVPITFRTSGLLAQESIFHLNGGATSVGSWLNANQFLVSGATTTYSSGPVSTAGVANAAPPEVYQSQLYGSESLNGHLLVNLPVANGTYTVRLHFAETIFGGAGNRKFDIVLNDQTVRQNYDIFVAAGGLNKAVVEEFSGITASGGAGLLIDLVNRIGGFPRGPMVSAIEVLRTNAIGTPDPRAEIELSSDDGVTWSTIGNNVAVDRFGIGTFNWTIPIGVQIGNNYRVRARTATTFSGNLQDVSDASFLITNGGQHFYINDDSTLDDVFTTSVGSNSNSGKTASQPLSSIAALLAAYELQPGDVVHIDTGIHRLVNSIMLTSEATGVRFEGPSTGTGAILDRGNINSPVIELRNADNVTLDHLTIQSGNFGVYANSSSNSDGLTISHSLIQLNDQIGVRLEESNDQVTIVNSTFDGGTGAAIQAYHVVLDGVASTIKGNSFFRSRLWYAVQANGQELLLEDNLLQNNRRNIAVSNGSTAAADRGVIRNNTLVGQSTVAQAAGIEASGNILVTGNDISNTPLGITGNVEIRGNIVHGNGIGISSAGLVTDNRIFNNTTIGLAVSSYGQAKNNRIYNNDVGIQIDGGSFFTVNISNNFVVNNTTVGLVLNSGLPAISNNAILQPTGDAILIVGGASRNVLIKNNIIEVGIGYAYNTVFDAREFKADYNIIHRSGTAKIARWENTDFNDPADWFYEVGIDEHSQFVDPQFVRVAGPDGRLGYDGGDYGADDNFAVLASSPTIDAGDPSDSFLNETAPNGGRVDIGGLGASSLLPAGKSQAIYMTDVTPLKKYEQGQTIPLDIRSYGVSANSTATLELSGDLGATWSSVQDNIAIDSQGYAQTNWTIPLNQPVGSNYQLRLSTMVNGNTISTTTRGGFRIANSGPDYFVSTTGDNRNSGKSFDQPMKSLPALVEQYDLDAGDVVNIAAGNYRTYRNIVLTSQDSGVTILGSSGSVPTISRGATLSGTRVLSIAGADSVTIDHLGITGAEIGIDAADGVDSNDVTIRNSLIFGNAYSGINIGTLNDRWTIDLNKLYGLPGGVSSDDQQYGLAFGFTFQGVPLSSTGHQIVRNEIYDHQADGIVNARGGTVISTNSIHGNRRGVTADTIFDPSGLPLLISSNQVRDNSEYGIYADTSSSSSPIVVSDNEVFGHNGTNDVGIYAYGGTQATGNRVYNNYTGIATRSDIHALTRVEQNRVYNNFNAGITTQGYSQVIGNTIYSNALGLLAQPTFSGQVTGNLLYANTNGGISIQTGIGSEYLNNTIYQSVGDAIRVESSSRDLRLANNLVWVDAGYGTYVAPDSQTNLRSDYNLIYLNGAAAKTGFWGSAQPNLASWQTASLQDAHSVDGNPGFVDIDGVDNRLGFAGGVDGGLDDNFYRTNNSPAIDRGNPWAAARVDIEGFRRSDDLATPNLGGPDYKVASIASEFQTSGVAQNFRTDNNVFSWTLPFAFSFYGTSYTSAYVSSNGFLQFGNSDNLFIESNTLATFIQNARIAGLWDDLTTTGVGDDVYLDTSMAGQATVRWNATNKFDSSDVQFSITLFATGKIQFNYGPGNTGLTPTVGISRGNSRHYELVSGYDGSATLTNANTTEFSIITGYSDIGAYEFRGQSDDTAAPYVAVSTPAALQSSGVVAGPVSQLQLTFSEEINPIDARSPAAYELRGAGANNTFNDADDIVYLLSPDFVPGQRSVMLLPRLSTGPLPGGSLPVGLYQVTVLAGIASSIHDLSGNRLDGNADGTQGDNYVRQFKIINNTAPVLSGLNPLTSILRDELPATNSGTLVSQLLNNQIVDPDGPGSGVAIASATSNFGTWQYTLDGATYQAIEPRLAGGKRLLLGADADTRIRFQPNAGFVGQATDLILSAWDRADELPEGLAVLAAELSAHSLSSQSSTATIVVAPRNEAPTDIVLSSVTVLENLAAGATVGSLSTVDSNSADTHTYQLTSGAGSTDNDLFEIVAGTVKTKSSFNFEAKPGYSIRVRSTDQGGLQVEKSLLISIVDLPELINGPVIGDGTTQRSIVKQIVVTLDREVTIGDSAFIVTRRDGAVVTSSATGVTNSQGQFIVTITFSGSVTHGGALNDGYYQLSMDGTKLTRAAHGLDINQDGNGGDSLVIGDDEADNFFALFGDTNGDGSVGVAEFGQFRSAFGKTSSDPGYNILFDFEGDSTIGISDFGQFRSRFGKPKLPF